MVHLSEGASVINTVSLIFAALIVTYGGILVH
jgi:hypothetical protein